MFQITFTNHKYMLIYFVRHCEMRILQHGYYVNLLLIIESDVG